MNVRPQQEQRRQRPAHARRRRPRQRQHGEENACVLRAQLEASDQHRRGREQNKEREFARDAARYAGAERAPKQRSRGKRVERGKNRIDRGIAKPCDGRGVKPFSDHPRSPGVVRRLGADDTWVRAAKHSVAHPRNPVAFGIVRMREKCEEQQQCGSEHGEREGGSPLPEPRSPGARTRSDRANHGEVALNRYRDRRRAPASCGSASLRKSGPLRCARRR